MDAPPLRSAWTLPPVRVSSAPRSSDVGGVSPEPVCIGSTHASRRRLDLKQGVSSKRMNNVDLCSMRCATADSSWSPGWWSGQRSCNRRWQPPHIGTPCNARPMAAWTLPHPPMHPRQTPCRRAMRTSHPSTAMQARPVRSTAPHRNASARRAWRCLRPTWCIRVAHRCMTRCWCCRSRRHGNPGYCQRAGTRVDWDHAGRRAGHDAPRRIALALKTPFPHRRTAG